MNSRKNTLFSKTLFLENFRRFWPSVMLGFLAYFVCGPFELILRRGEMSGYMVRALVLHNYAFMFLSMILPTVMSVTVFAYLNRNSSVQAYHAMPFTRHSLFVTQYVSGLTLSLLPLLLNMLLIAAFIGPVQVGGGVTSPEILTAAAVLRMLAVNFVIMLFTYSICAFAGIVSGNSVVHALTNYGLNFVFPAIVGILAGYSGVMLYGVVPSDTWLEVILRLHPLFFYLRDGVIYGYDGTGFSALSAVLYVLASLIITIAACSLYKLRKLEKAQSSYVFGFMRWFVLLVLVFAASSLFGLVLSSIFGKWGYVVGALLGFLFGQMFVTKTFNIFNRESLKPLIVSVLMMALVVGGFSMDLLGIEKRVPDPASVEKVETTLIGGTAFFYRDPENLGRITALHRDVLSHKEFKQAAQSYYYGEYANPVVAEWASDDDGFVPSTMLNIEYTLKSGRIVSRSYEVPALWLAQSEDADAIFSSAETIALLNKLLSKSGEELQNTGISVSTFGSYYGEETFSLADRQALLSTLKEELAVYQTGSFSKYIESRHLGRYTEPYDKDGAEADAKDAGDWEVTIYNYQSEDPDDPRYFTFIVDERYVKTRAIVKNAAENYSRLMESGEFDYDAYMNGDVPQAAPAE